MAVACGGDTFAHFSLLLPKVLCLDGKGVGGRAVPAVCDLSLPMAEGWDVFLFPEMFPFCGGSGDGILVACGGGVVLTAGVFLLACALYLGEGDGGAASIV